ncbi:MAG: GGDEF domain-containing protein [Ruminococcus sp.]|nr:GGDEF domain-containing protein [Ruminococcus sp.]
MDFQAMVDGIDAYACVVSVEKTTDGSYGKLRIVTGNKQYIDSIENPLGGVEMLTRKFEPNSEYTNYMTRDMNFEDSCYQAALNKKSIHSYAHPDRFDVWFNMSFVPVVSDNEQFGYCMYIMEIDFKPDAKRMSAISSEIASSVLETCIKLRDPEDFNKAMNDICEDIRDLCESEHCCILLMDTAKRTCSVLCEAFSKDTKLLPMATYVDDSFYDIADSWKDTIAGSNCLIAKNDHDWEIVKERNPLWYESISGAGGKTIVLFPLIFKGELFGYIWAINFKAEKAGSIKETLELTAFILASEIYSNRLFERLLVLSSRDMLTGIMNRNEMNNYVDRLAADDSHKSVGVLFADLNGLKVINDTDGHVAGDNLLKDAAGVLRKVFNLYEVFRAGGDEFVAIITGTTEEELAQKAEALRRETEGHKDLVFAVGTAFEEDAADIRRALHLADQRMYVDKKKYYKLNPDKKYIVKAVQ